jgi:hypothetical protein
MKENEQREAVVEALRLIEARFSTWNARLLLYQSG